MQMSQSGCPLSSSVVFARQCGSTVLVVVLVVVVVVVVVVLVVSKPPLPLPSAVSLPWLPSSSVVGVSVSVVDVVSSGVVVVAVVVVVAASYSQ